MSMTALRLAAASALLVISSQPTAEAATRQTTGSVKIEDPVAITIVNNPALQVLLSGGAPPVFMLTASTRFGVVTEVDKDEAAGLSVSIARGPYRGNDPRVFLIVAQFN